LNNFSRQELLDLLNIDFETGVIIRKPRPVSDFSNKRLWNSWNSRFADKPCVGLDSNGYITFSIRGARFLAHRVIWFLKYEEVPDKIDHINGNKSDNRIVNLRNVSHRENLQNCKLSSASTTKITGVHFYKSRGKYTAQITVDYKTIHLGYFDTKEEALQARLDAELKYNHKNFRRI